MSRRALIQAASITVTCPFCYEPQAEPKSGAFLWQPADIEAAQGGHECAACGCSYALVYRSKVDAPLPTSTRTTEEKP